MILLVGRSYKSARRGKGSCERRGGTWLLRSSTGGTTTKDMDDVAFLAKQIVDEDAMEMDVLGSSFC